MSGKKCYYNHTDIYFDRDLQAIPVFAVNMLVLSAEYRMTYTTSQKHESNLIDTYRTTSISAPAYY